MLLLMFLCGFSFATKSNGELNARRNLIAKVLLAAIVLVAIFVGGYFWIENGKKLKLEKAREAKFNQKLKEIETATEKEDVRKAIFEALQMCRCNEVFKFTSFEAFFLIWEKKRAVDLLKKIYNQKIFKLFESGEKKELKDISFQGIKEVFVFVKNDCESSIKRSEKVSSIETKEFIWPQIFRIDSETIMYNVCFFDAEEEEEEEEAGAAEE